MGRSDARPTITNESVDTWMRATQTCPSTIVQGQEREHRGHVDGPELSETPSTHLLAVGLVLGQALVEAQGLQASTQLHEAGVDLHGLPKPVEFDAGDFYEGQKQASSEGNPCVKTVDAAVEDIPMKALSDHQTAIL